MKSIRKLAGGIAAVATAALVLGACGSSGSEGSPAQSGSVAGSSDQSSSSGNVSDGGSSGGSTSGPSTPSDAGSADGSGAQPSTPSKPVTLDFRIGFASDSPQLKELKKLTKAYEDAHPNVTVQITSDSSNYEADMKVRMAAHNVPDLWTTHGWSLLRYSPFLEPLNTQPWAKNFNPALDAAMKNSKGQFFALPIDTDVSGIVYSKVALQKAGVDPESLKTWDDFNSALATLKGKDIIPISASSKDSWLAGDLIDFIASGAFNDQQLKGFQDGTFDSDGYGKLMDLIGTWAKNKDFNPDFASASQDDIAQNLATGKTAFVFVQNGIVANAKTFDPNAKLGFMPVPTFDGNPFLIGGEDYAIGVSKTSKHKGAALDYLNYLAQPKNIKAQADVIGGLAGLTNAKVDLGDLQDSFDTFVTGNKYPLEPYFDRVYLPSGAWDSMISTVSGVVTGQMSADEATKQMASKYKSLYQQQNS